MRFKTVFRVTPILAFVIFTNVKSLSQTIGNSPYSSLGVGEILPVGYAENQGMAGVGVASSLGLYVNTLNPALLARNKYTVFSMGMLGYVKAQKSETETQRSFAMNLHYLNLSFPVRKNWSMGLAIQPYAQTDFTLRTAATTVPNDTTKYISNFRAKGGINKVSWTNAWEHKEFMFGLELSPMFGQITRNNETQLANDGQFYRVVFNNATNYRGIYYKLGTAWHHKITKDKYLNLGVAFEPNNRLRAERVLTSQNFDSNGTPLILADTLSNETKKYTLPSELRMGISYEKSLNYTLFADITLRKSSQLVNFENANDGLKDSYTVGIGAEYFPDFTSTKFLKRAVYRAGVNFGTSPYSHLQTQKQLTEYAFSTGLGLPLRNSSYLNISYSVGRRGGVANGGLSENYNKISVGFTLNDVWFIKQRID